jgi:hypothetical protein
MEEFDFFKELTSRLVSPKFSIESFSVENLGCSFSKMLGPLFSQWTALTFLRLGDRSNIHGRGGYFHVEAYTPVSHDSSFSTHYSNHKFRR